MKMGKKRVALLGATGSIGDSTLKVIRAFPEDFELVGIASKGNHEKLYEIAKEFCVRKVALFDERAFEAFPREDFEVYGGKEGLIELVEDEGVDMVVMAILGFDGIEVMLKAIEAGKTVAIASKEILVMAGELVMGHARKYNAKILPIDSEHSGIFQCLMGESSESISKVIITASGGPFRNFSLAELEKVTVEQALCHPNWKMGKKVTLDCATLANKGLELIEARWLFDLEPEKLDAVIHPQSIIHALVQFRDGSIKGQLSYPRMTYPIEFALHYPLRKDTFEDFFDFSKVCTLELGPPDYGKFRCLQLAKDALLAGGLASTIFNAANDVAGEAFLKNEISFLDIPEIIDNVLQRVSNRYSGDLAGVQSVDAESRALAETFVHELRYIL